MAYNPRKGLLLRLLNGFPIRFADNYSDGCLHPALHKVEDQGYQEVVHNSVAKNQEPTTKKDPKDKFTPHFNCADFLYLLVTPQSY